MNLIKCENLTVKFHKKTVLDNISVTIPPNKITVIIGKNGSGKSTLFKAIENTVSFSGNILIDGEKNTTIKRSLFAKKISLMPQFLPAPHITVETLVSYGRSPHSEFSGKLTNEDLNIINNAIKNSKLEELRNSYADKLSGGELRRAFFAMTEAQSTPIILFDEPTSNLDVTFKKEILNLICKSKGQNKTTAVVLHDINDAFEIADNIIVLDKGQHIFSGPPQDAEDEEIPQKIFGMKKLISKNDYGEEIIFYR